MSSIPEKYAHYFEKLDTPSVITDLNLRIVWKNDAVKTFYKEIRRSSSIQYYIDKYSFAALKRMEPGDRISLHFLLDEYTPGFAKRKEDCYILRISRFNSAAQKRISELFKERYLSKGYVASDPTAFEPEFDNISTKKLDRLVGIFAGLDPERMMYMDITTPLSQFARQATEALYGIEVRYKCNVEHLPVYFNVADLYMLLSALTGCLISSAPYETLIRLDSKFVDGSVVINLRVRKTANVNVDELIKIYKDYNLLDEICEYGHKYLNLLLINAICDNYDWYFEVHDGPDEVSVSIKMHTTYSGETSIALYNEDMNDDIINIMLSHFRMNKKDSTEEETE